MVSVKRFWPQYNRELVKRGEFFLDLSLVQNWDNELMEMNANKVGPPFQYPNSLFEVNGIWHSYRVPYRMIQGMMIDFVKLAQLPKSCNYTTSCRRVNRLDLSLFPPDPNKKLVIFCDGVAFQAIESGEYLRETYGKENRRWIHVVLWGDADSIEPVSYEVHLTQTNEWLSGLSQLNDISNKTKIHSAGGDGAFDVISFWNAIEAKGILPIIKPDKTAISNSESYWRNTYVKYRAKKGHKKWVKKTGYGKRWLATEVIFSAVKRMFGENLRARSEKGLMMEAAIKFWAYQRVKRCYHRAP
jgi:hypothetical protein